MAALSRARKPLLIAYDEGAVFRRNHVGDITDIHRSSRQSGGHSLHQRNRKLLAIRRQGKDIKQTDEAPGTVKKARHVHILQSVGGCLGDDRRSLRPFPHHDQLQPILVRCDRTDQPGDILDRAQSGKRADQQLAGRAHQTGNRVCHGRDAIARDVNTIADKVQPMRGLLPDVARNAFQQHRRHDKAMRPLERNAAKKIALGL